MAFIVACLVAVSSMGQGPAASGPRWQCDKTTFDFGEVWAGTPVIHPFEFKNVGTAPLIILEAKPHCSCSVSENFTRETPPGQTGVIPFRLGTESKAGQIKEYIAVKTNDPAQPTLTVYMTGLVRTVCDVEVIADTSDVAKEAPPGLLKRIKKAGAHFGVIDANRRVQRLIRMKNTSGSPLALSLFATEPSESRFHVELKETKKGEEFELQVTGEPPFAVGNNYATFLFHTGLEGQPTYRLPATAYVPARIEVVPEKIVVAPNYPTIPNRKVTITNNGTMPLEVRSVASTDPAIKVALLPKAPGDAKESVVSVNLPFEGWRPPAWGEIVRIETTDKEKGRIDIYVLPDLYKEPAPRPADKPLVFHPGQMPAPSK